MRVLGLSGGSGGNLDLVLAILGESSGLDFATFLGLRSNTEVYPNRSLTAGLVFRSCTLPLDVI